jgi:hypothetical protein
MVYRTAAPYDEVEADIEHLDANTLTVRTPQTPSANQYTVVAAAPGTAGGLTYTYTQSSPSANWSITHNLNRYPAVDVVDSGGTQIEPDIHYVDSNNVVVNFGSPTSGKAYLN